MARLGRVAVVPAGLLRPVAASEVAARLVRAAEDGPGGRLTDLAGPRDELLTTMVRRLAEAEGDPVRPVELRLPGAFWRSLRVRRPARRTGRGPRPSRPSRSGWRPARREPAVQRQGRGPGVDGGDLGLAREHLLGEHAVHLGVRVRAGVREHGEAEVEVGGLPQRGEHDAARRDAREHERADAAGAQQHVEVAAGERADAALRDDRLVVAAAERGGDLRSLVLLGAAVAAVAEGARRPCWPG